MYGGAAVKTEPGYVRIKVQMEYQRDHYFTIRKDEAIQTALVRYCKLEELDFSTIRFFVDGKRVQAGNTPEGLEMEDEDTIDAFLHMVGGSASQISYLSLPHCIVYHYH
ncbi:unnamed protein product [Cuscuta campestris]|uniref:Ubiquitin-like domain-containing protein n=1 Tax=Cuscuta campestris TaxID=132261 RepID=A0A484NQH7_9ASTE|nr:unnamed protein product [Cuscuta campestris]